MGTSRPSDVRRTIPRPVRAVAAIALLAAAMVALALEPVGLSPGQRLYVPVYSQIYLFSKGNETPLAVTLSFRNTDLKGTVVVHDVVYHDTDGTPIRRLVDEPVRVGPLGTVSYVIGQRDKAGGTGANFIVEWSSDQPVTAPIVETIMVGVSGNRAYSFTSEGRVIAE